MLLKVTLVFDDKTMTLEGEEAMKWDSHSITLATIADIHGMNPFKHDPIKWNIVDKAKPLTKAEGGGDGITRI